MSFNAYSYSIIFYEMSFVNRGGRFEPWAEKPKLKDDAPNCPISIFSSSLTPISIVAGL